MTLCLCADIICIQELKLSKKDMHQVKTFAMPMGWYVLHPCMSIA